MSGRIAGAIVALVVGAFLPGVSMAAGLISGQGVERGGPMIPGGIEISRAPYQESTSDVVCDIANECSVKFTTVPLKARLEITDASCFVGSDHELSGIQLGVMKPNNSPAFVMLLEPAYHTSSSPFLTSADDQVFAFANAGQHIQLLAGTLNGFHITMMFCSISGSIVKLKK